MTQDNAQPLVAFVTPVYNGDRYLEETLESVQKQDYANIVHVVVDNASTDATPRILEKYANARIPLRVSRNPATVPVVQNFNRALSFVPPEARYFRILCADDTVSPNYTTETVALAERNPNVGMVGCDIHEGAQTEDAKWPRDRGVFPGLEAIRRVFLDQGIIRAPHVLVRREHLDRKTPFYTPGLYAADIDACLNVLTQSDWGFVHKDLAFARVHQDTVTNREVFRSNIHFLEWSRLLETYAPIAFAPKDAERIIARFRGHYLRALLRWRFDGRNENYKRHIHALSEIDRAPSALQYADAFWDWTLIKAGRRPPWTGWPFDPKANVKRG